MLFEIFALIGILVIYFFILKKRENFDGTSIVISWKPSDSDIKTVAYKWKLSNGKCGSTASWTVEGSTPNTSVTIDSTVCPQCSYGGNLCFSVAAYNTQDNNFISSWTTSDINLSSEWNSTLSITGTSGSPLQPSVSQFLLTWNQNQISSYSNVNIVAHITLSRGTQTYTLNIDMGSQGSVTSSGISSIISLTDPRWSKSPQFLSQGDIVSCDVIAYQSPNIVLSKATITTTIVNQTPGAPKDISWQIIDNSQKLYPLYGMTNNWNGNTGLLLFVDDVVLSPKYLNYKMNVLSLSVSKISDTNITAQQLQTAISSSTITNIMPTTGTSGNKASILTLSTTFAEKFAAQIQGNIILNK